MNSSRFVAIQWLLFTLLAGMLFYLLAPILTPFVAAAILAYICNPLVQWLGGKKVSRTTAVLLVMAGGLLLCAGLLLIMLPLMFRETNQFMLRLPDWVEAARSYLEPLFYQWFGVAVEWDVEALKGVLMSHWQSAGKVASQLLPWLGGKGGALLDNLVSLMLVPVAMFYLLRDWDGLIARLDGLIPRHLHDKVREVAGEVDGVLAEFLRGQISVMLLMSVYYSVTLWAVGLEFALPIGIVAGMLVFIPYLGMVTGLLLATLVAVMQFGELSGLLWVWAAFGAGQLIEGMLVTPWLVGDRIGLHPLAVIFALLAFGQLFGFFGILLALPLSAALLVGLRHIVKWYLSSNMYLK
ncbi:MAG: AI-2E family transporter [Gallionella sp.]|nr:AI-2E family transporter [Gallionella sp.]MDD4945595.1 AI-2E family transporter [Gallionella sp.]